MPPKKKADAPTKKTVEKKKEKVIEVRSSQNFKLYIQQYGSCYPL